MTLRHAVLAVPLWLVASCGPGDPPVPAPPTPAHAGSLVGEVIESVNAQIQAIERDPGSGAARKQLGLLYLANGAPAEAAEAFRQSLMLDAEDPQTWCFHATALEQINELDAAIESIAVAQDLDPERAPLYWRPGFWLLEAGRPEEALPHFESAAAIESRAGRPAPDGAAHRIGRGRCLLELDRPGEAVPILEELQTMVDHYYASYLLGQAYRRVGRGDEAAPVRASGAIDPPSYPDPWMDAVSASGRGLDARLAWIEQLLEARRLDEAARALVEARKRWPEDVNLLNRLAELHRSRGNTTAWVRTLKQAVRIDPSHASSQHNLSIALQRQGEVSQAMNHAHLAVTANPSFTPAWLQLGRLLVIANRLNQDNTNSPPEAVHAALEPLDRAFELGVEGPREHLMYGHLLMRAQRLDDAIRVLSRLTDQPDGDPRAWAILSDAHAAKGEHRSALQTAINGLNRFPNHPDLMRIADRYRRASGGAPGQP
ncbi:MAG: tetratricopeptide repeat protein [Phycisphaerales bacterium]|jgi:tetratricopeptide (TPR) repeat protein|nr:tetratricopeptide repeat protein [Phycisphaerales bacterium]